MVFLERAKQGESVPTMPRINSSGIFACPLRGAVAGLCTTAFEDRNHAATRIQVSRS